MIRGWKIGSVEIIVFHNVLGGDCRSWKERQAGEDLKIFDFFPAGKGKLEKIAIRISLRCDCKGAWEDFRQEIFELVSATAALQKYSVEYSLRASRTPKITLRIIFFGSALTCVTADSPPCDTRRKPVHHGSLVLMWDQGFLQSPFHHPL